MTEVLRRPAPQVALAVTACALLLARPWLWSLGPPAWSVGAGFAVLGAAGATWPLRNRGPTAAPRTVASATGLGLAVFGVARLLGRGLPPLALGRTGVGLAVLAAVAEEALFRRFLYSFLMRGGPNLAVLGSAACFALVHVGIYGLGVLPLDLTAGLVLSAQRRSAGTWLVPAVSHVAANLLAIY